MLVSFSPVAQHRLIGDDLVATSLLLLSIILAFFLLHLLAAVAFGSTTPSATSKALHTMVAIVILMSAVLRQGQGSPIGHSTDERATVELVETEVSLEDGAVR